MEHTVSGCKDCPFFNDGSSYEYIISCQHPHAPNQELLSTPSMKTTYEQKVVQPITPEWCPLNQESITIIKK